jgi:hypothetical protein
MYHCSVFGVCFYPFSYCFLRLNVLPLVNVFISRLYNVKPEQQFAMSTLFHSCLGLMARQDQPLFSCHVLVI